MVLLEAVEAAAPPAGPSFLPGCPPILALDLHCAAFLLLTSADAQVKEQYLFHLLLPYRIVFFYIFHILASLYLQFFQ
jgi:hypothetical protein